MEDFKKALQKAAKDKRIPCKLVMKIADEHQRTYKEAGQILNELGVKISNCQLGCFP